LNLCSKLGLGTAQWGLLYGAWNVNGIPDEDAVGAMLKNAVDAGINLLDTAQAYGTSEKIIGKQISFPTKFQVFTKTRPIRSLLVKKNMHSQIIAELLNSIKCLKRDYVDGVFIHHAEDLFSEGGDVLWDELQRLKKSNKIGKLGVSVYCPEQLKKILNNFEIDVVQIPLNIYDQRFIKTGLLKTLRRQSIEVHARSVFLQGLLLQPWENLRGPFEVIRPHQKKLVNHLENFNITPYQASLFFCLLRQDVDRVIVGCETPEQLDKLIMTCRDSLVNLPADMTEYCLDNEDIINPSNWNKNRVDIL
jgi:aryl-alcohol dehydrogenase-like predicted oxidoreductase